jgi:hypothetical protein
VSRTGRSAWKRWIALPLGLAVIYAGIDLYWPIHSNLRGFDPDALGKQETLMWRSYYDRKPVALFFELAQMLRSQFGFPPLRSVLGAIHASRAAFVFKDGKARPDYEQALPILKDYFGVIHRTGNIDFDVQQAATTELEWWIVHRERTKYPGEALGRACAEAAATLYRVPVESTQEHGRLRAAAMVIRDTCAASGGVGENDWGRIDSLLQRCYESLHLAIAESQHGIAPR